jgi:hypothetical protein
MSYVQLFALRCYLVSPVPQNVETESFKPTATIQWRREICLESESRDSPVGIATGYGLDDRGIGFRVSVKQEFSLLHVVQTGSGAHSASYPVGTGDSFLGVKWPGREADHSPPTSAEVK